ncbi:MAG: hypothetical protein J6330_03380 [Clostridia bacterium]|nr:hypothetical protein [Clostridia bacterium]
MKKVISLLLALATAAAVLAGCTEAPGDTSADSTAGVTEPVSVVLSDDGKTVTVKFKNVGSGLTSTSGGASVAGFSIGTANKTNNCEAKIISADTVAVHVPDDAKTTMLAYAFENTVTEKSAQLYSSTGLPALAFMVSPETAQ